MEWVAKYGENFKESGRFVGLDLDRAHKGAGTGGEGVLLNGIVRGGPHDGCFESRDGLFAEGCGHGGDRKRGDVKRTCGRRGARRNC